MPGYGGQPMMYGGGQPVMGNYGMGAMPPQMAGYNQQPPQRMPQSGQDPFGAL